MHDSRTHRTRCRGRVDTHRASPRALERPSRETLRRLRRRASPPRARVSIETLGRHLPRAMISVVCDFQRDARDATRRWSLSSPSSEASSAVQRARFRRTNRGAHSPPRARAQVRHSSPEWRRVYQSMTLVITCFRARDDGRRARRATISTINSYTRVLSRAHASPPHARARTHTHKSRRRAHPRTARTTPEPESTSRGLASRSRRVAAGAPVSLFPSLLNPSSPPWRAESTARSNTYSPR